MKVLKLDNNNNNNKRKEIINFFILFLYNFNDFYLFFYIFS